MQRLTDSTEPFGALVLQHFGLDHRAYQHAVEFPSVGPI